MFGPQPQHDYREQAQWAKWLTLGLCVSFILSFVLWQALRELGGSWVILLFQIVPLLIFIPAMKRNNPRAYIGLCFVILLYFIKGVEGVFHPAMAWIDVSTLCFSVTLFISAMMASRWLQFAQVQQRD